MKKNYEEAKIKNLFPFSCSSGTSLGEAPVEQAQNSLFRLREDKESRLVNTIHVRTAVLKQVILLKY
jgi:hypothetical protein